MLLEDLKDLGVTWSAGRHGFITLWFGLAVFGLLGLGLVAGLLGLGSVGWLVAS